MILDTQVLNLFLCLQKHLDVRTVPITLPLDINPLILLNNNKPYVNTWSATDRSLVELSTLTFSLVLIETSITQALKPGLLVTNFETKVGEEKTFSSLMISWSSDTFNLFSRLDFKLDVTTEPNSHRIFLFCGKCMDCYYNQGCLS